MTRNETAAAGAKPMRADARRNYDRLVTHAKAAFLEQGTNASLEDIARRAGVGIGTLYRHFPHRTALIDAVFQEEANALIALADELTGADDPFEALAIWLRAVLTRHSAYRGIAAALMEPDRDPESNATSGSSMIPVRGAGGVLLERAQQAGAVRKDTDILDLMRLAGAIGLVAEKTPEDPGLADRLLLLTTDGLRVRA
jgi:AcrR family transcriptional regulator